MTYSLSLSREQIEIVHRSAADVPMRWKHRYLAALADALTCRPSLTDRDVVVICSAIKRRFALGIGPPILDNDIA
jgi:hypothetical protein